jgi:hypothetical protein
MNLISFVCATLLLVSVDSKNVNVCNEELCIVRYLEVRNAINSSIAQELGNIECDNCETGIVNILRIFRAKFNKEIRDRLTVDDNETCILNLFEEHEIFTLYLKGFTHRSLELSQVKRSFKETAAESTAKILWPVQMYGACAVQMYGSILNGTVNSFRLAKSRNLNETLYKCLKKHAFDEKIIDLEEFNVPEINATHCQLLLKDFNDILTKITDFDETETIYGLSSVNADKCIFRGSLEEKFALLIAMFGLAFKLDLTEEQELKVRYELVKAMKMNVNFLLTCLQKMLREN